MYIVFGRMRMCTPLVMRTQQVLFCFVHASLALNQRGAFLFLSFWGFSIRNFWDVFMRKPKSVRALLCSVQCNAALAALRCAAHARSKIDSTQRTSDIVWISVRLRKLHCSSR